MRGLAERLFTATLRKDRDRSYHGCETVVWMRHSRRFEADINRSSGRTVSQCRTNQILKSKRDMDSARRRCVLAETRQWLELRRATRRGNLYPTARISRGASGQDDKTSPLPPQGRPRINFFGR